MAEFIFDGKKIVQPGVYSRVKSGVNNPPIQLPYGNVLIIDKDETSFHGGGAGIVGEFSSGKDSLESFNTITDFRDFVGGGLFWDLAQPLFRPFGSGASGASTLYYARALTTTPSELEVELNAGTLEFKCKNEGLSGNGVLVSTVLTRGYSMTLTAGVFDSGKFIVKFHRGTFKGNDENNQSYDDLVEAETLPEIVAESPEISTVQELIQWTQQDANFINNFVVSSGGSVTGDIIAADVTAFSAHQVFTGGTSTYTTARVDDILQAIKDMNISYILTADKGSDATSVDNMKIVTFLDTEMPDPATLVVAGGNTSGTFESQSLAAAAAYNSQNAIVVHGGCKIPNLSSPIGLKEKSVLYKTAAVLGRISGLAPQIPGTYKGIDIAKELHELNSGERDMAIRGGVLATVYSEQLGFHTILQAINTIQDNRNVVNSNGTSSSISVVRIAKQLLRELKLNAIVDLLGDQENGPNRATLDEETVRSWVKGYLTSKEATATVDDLIIDSRDIVVSVNQDSYQIKFGFTPNYEVNKMFITATILDNSFITN